MPLLHKQMLLSLHFCLCMHGIKIDENWKAVPDLVLLYALLKYCSFLEYHANISLAALCQRAINQNSINYVKKKNVKE